MRKKQIQRETRINKKGGIKGKYIDREKDRKRNEEVTERGVRERKRGLFPVLLNLFFSLD
jgi:hypothetical protein